MKGERDLWGKIGEGPSRNMYKGHMDKAKGWEVGMSGVGAWSGKNGDNCTSTTINKYKK